MWSCGVGEGGDGVVVSGEELGDTGSTGHNVYPVYACNALGQGSRKSG